MKYTKEWLQRVRSTKDLITTLRDNIQRVPVQYRFIVAGQLGALSHWFDKDLNEAHDTAYVESQITDLGLLITELVKDADKCGEFS